MENAKVTAHAEGSRTLFSTTLCTAPVDIREVPCSRRLKPPRPGLRRLTPGRASAKSRTMSDEKTFAGEDAAETPPASGEAEPAEARSGLAYGVEVIRSVVRTLPARPGVYRMLDAKGDALYVGKA